jgi:hypothetical protein
VRRSAHTPRQASNGAAIHAVRPVAPLPWAR